MFNRKHWAEYLALAALAALPGMANADLLDFGDAPDSYGTTLANNGARHGAGGPVYLGSVAPDYEADGTPALFYGAKAIGDDINGSAGFLEESGVQFIGSFFDAAGTTAYGNAGGYYAGYWGKVVVTLHATDHANLTDKIYLDGWLDFGHNGIFGDQSGTTSKGNWTENIVSSVIDPTQWASDEQSFTFMFLNGSGPTGPFYSRFRVNYGGGTNAPTGYQANGEVEDYGGLLHAQYCPEPASNYLLLGAFLALTGVYRLRRH